MCEGRIRVLLADDHAVVRAGIRQFLEFAGDMDVVAEADDGEQAKTLIQQCCPDVAVLDIQMPRANGIEVTRWARANARETGVLVLTAYDDDPYVIAVLRAGAHGYVLKTADPTEIIQSVRDVHAGKTAIHPQVAHKLPQEGACVCCDTMSDLSEREMEVLRLMAKGCTNRGIGSQLQISDRTVQGHVARIFHKTGSASRTEAVMKAVSLGLISPAVLSEG